MGNRGDIRVCKTGIPLVCIAAALPNGVAGLSLAGPGPLPFGQELIYSLYPAAFTTQTYELPFAERFLTKSHTRLSHATRRKVH